MKYPLLTQFLSNYLVQGGSQETDDFEQIIALLVLNIEHFYLCRMEGKR